VTAAGTSLEVEAFMFTLSSTLAAGVNGGSAIRFIGTTGVNAGEMEGSGAACTEGVDNGVAILEVTGRE
jgi:hypothetical protein